MNGIKLIAAATAMAVSTVACASAETKLASKKDYRQAQVRAIEVQRQADIVAAQAASAERVAMWNALSTAVQANPDTASHMAIVAAVASTRGSNGETVTKGNVVQLRPERETTALDWAKVLAPGLIGGVTQAGLAAIAAETQRDSIQANRDIRIQEIVTDGQVWGLMNNIVDEYDDDELTMVDDTVVDDTAQDVDVDVDVDEPVDIVVDDDSTDDGVTDVVDDSFDDTSTNDEEEVLPDDDGSDDLIDIEDDSTEPEPYEYDCSAVGFSPRPPQCQS